MTALVWFRRDLRLTDNPALARAVAGGGPIIPVFILDDADAGADAPGGAARWWLHGSLAALERDLRKRGSRLILRRGAAAQVIKALIAETGAQAIYWNRRYEPWAIARDQTIKRDLTGAGLEVHSSNASLLAEPWTLTTGAGTPFKIYTPFWKALRAQIDLPLPIKAPRRISAPAVWPVSDDLDTWRLKPRAPDWAAGFGQYWTPGEAAAAKRLTAFVDAPMADYGERRNLPGVAGSSRLSPHLHFGEIGPAQVWRAAMGTESWPRGAEVFLSEIVWREFGYNLLYHFPSLPTAPLRAGFDEFPWRDDPAGLLAWQRGLTGYPIVDAGMRELWATGWMHNRVRMIVASFLIKDLLIDWRRGAAWFWDTLVDADLASNAANWQWVAGSGTDAAPYHRIFNPVLQGEKFDPAGVYVRRWVPELAALPDQVIHQPWAAAPLDLAAAKVTLGRTYPQRLVDHAVARDRALAILRR